MLMLGAKNTRVLLRIFMIRKTMAVRGYSWTHDETVLLIELWGDDHVQQQLDTTPKRNIDIFRRVCQDIKDRLPEFSRSVEDCRARIKRLKRREYDNLCHR
jgi:GTP cyclohydrolase I